jgi:hypothetical protein
MFPCNTIPRYHRFCTAAEHLLPCIVPVRLQLNGVANFLAVIGVTSQLGVRGGDILQILLQHHTIKGWFRLKALLPTKKRLVSSYEW